MLIFGALIACAIPLLVGLAARSLTSMIAGTLISLAAVGVALFQPYAGVGVWVVAVIASGHFAERTQRARKARKEAKLARQAK